MDRIAVEQTGPQASMVSRAGGLEVGNAVLEILLTTNQYTGECFFQHLTDCIASYFGVDGVYLCELALGDEICVLLASHQGRHDLSTSEFLGTGGALNVVLERGDVALRGNVVQQFPKDNQLKTLRAEAFVGTVLRSASQDPIGALFLVHPAPLARAQFIDQVLQQLAPRIGAELERWQRELAIRHSESRLRLLTDRSKDVLFYYQLEPAIEIQYISPAVEDVFGLPQEAFHGNPELLFDMLDADERVRFEAALESGSEEPLVAKINIPGGGTRWVEYRDFSVQERDQTIGIGGTVRDITRRVEAERALQEREHYMRTLLESIPDTLLLVRLDGVILDFLPGEVNTGFSNAEQVSGRNLKDLMSPAIVAVLERMMRASSRSNRLQQVQFEVPGDRPRFYEMRCLPFEQGNMLLVMRDLTAQKWHEGEEHRQRLRDEIDERIESRSKSKAYALTYRELAVLSLIVEGMADKQIADELGISIYTVNKHVGNVLGKMNAASRTEAGVRAVKEGLLPHEHARTA